MDSHDAVTVVDGVVLIDDPEIEAGLATLARRWSMSAEQALSRALIIGIAQERLRRGSRKSPIRSC